MRVAELDLDTIFLSLKGISRLALAVSGGSDSMALLRMVHEWASRDVQIFALSVDHGLRAEAAAEAAQVAAWCASIGVGHQILRWHHEGIGTGVQAKARQARYDLMTGWCLDHDVPVLLTAHTADDQAETVAMRRARTDAAASLAGIWPERDWKGVRIMRPLLRARRGELRSYLHHVGQAWLEDPSNEDDHYERVRVRRSLAGSLHDLPRAAEGAQALVTRNRAVAHAWCTQHFLIHEMGFLTVQRGALAELEADVLDIVVQRMIDLCGRPESYNEREKRMALQNWLCGQKIGRRTLGGALFAKRKDSVLIGREAGRISIDAAVVPASGQIIWDDRFDISAPVGATIVPAGQVVGIARRPNIPAFVQAGLPAVLLDGALLAVPHLHIGKDAAVKFLRC